jgi:hypothetical protein
VAAARSAVGLPGLRAREVRGGRTEGGIDRRRSRERRGERTVHSKGKSEVFALRDNGPTSRA